MLIILLYDDDNNIKVVIMINNADKILLAQIIQYQPIKYKFQFIRETIKALIDVIHEPKKH